MTRKILQVAWPLIIANSFWNLQMTIDRIFLGQLSTESLGAAMTVMGVFWVPMALLQQTAAYVSTFVAQYFGAKEEDKIGAAVWQSLYVSVIGGILFLGLNGLAPAFFKMVGHSESIQKLELEYFVSISYSALPTALVAAVSGFFSGLGNTRIVLWINFAGMILNAILDYAMIFGRWGFPALGIAGAGYATALATYGAAFLAFAFLFTRAHEEKFRMISARALSSDLLKKFLKFGLPSGFQWALEGLAFTVFLIIMGKMAGGEAALAASSIAVTVMMISVLPSMGVAQAILILVGQYLGEKKPDQAEKVTWGGVRIAAMYMAVVAASFFFFPSFYLAWFKNPDSAALWNQVVEIAPGILKWVAFFTVLDSIYLCLSFALKGAGDTRAVSILALTVPWPIMVLPTFLVRDMPNAVFISWGFVAIYSMTITSLILFRFRGGKWKSMSVIGV
ncbi:MAG: MATE family efflux transporter [Bdellovibrionales bacterium]|nr:MATE family efflux transporter [Bdellovibrionales bacterium]